MTFLFKPMLFAHIYMQPKTDDISCWPHNIHVANMHVFMPDPDPALITSG